MIVKNWVKDRLNNVRKELVQQGSPYVNVILSLFWIRLGLSQPVIEKLKASKLSTSQTKLN